MSIFKSLTTLVATPVRCLGELGKDLSCLTECVITGVSCEGNKKFNVKRCKHCGKVKK